MYIITTTNGQIFWGGLPIIPTEYGFGVNCQENANCSFMPPEVLKYLRIKIWVYI